MFLECFDPEIGAYTIQGLEIRESLDRFRVRYEDNYPIARTKYQVLYLNASNDSLQLKTPDKVASVAYEPFTESAIFTYRFNEDTELSGNMKLKLWVSTNKGSDMDLFVAVKKLDAKEQVVHFYAKTGYNKGPVAMGWLRVSERELDREKSTAWQPVLAHKETQKISPNEIVPVEIEILPSSTFFKKGEYFQLVIQGKDIHNLPSLGHHYSVNKGVHSIHTGSEYDAHILVPIIPN